MNTGSFRQTFSAEFMDMAVRSRATREWLLKAGSRRLHRFFVEENEEDLPERVGELRWRAIVNLLHSFADAVGDGRISPPSCQPCIGHGSFFPFASISGTFS